MSVALRLVHSVESDHIPKSKEALRERFHAVPGESKEERAKRLSAERSKRYRLKQKHAVVQSHQVKVPAMTFYGGTALALADVCKAGGFQEHAEALTLMAHGASNLAKNDPEAFAHFFAPVLAALAIAGADLAKRDGDAFALLVAPPSRAEVTE
ncbi:hypothetical protein G7007_18895 [Pseudomonas entomophila]|uniref:hypothetical protein n=1 Tax=Pseudomonas entomophila TaxID=312306 RepID=UPI0015E48968|nr:hypothetical protein [Pseudomonas entomophila]EKT4458369.1 hypothetical protein [Pseudomonas putida]MBA1194897.1 hypothetical protein [Pseudomonas entomophila]